jgi:hypothetical protein
MFTLRQAKDSLVAVYDVDRARPEQLVSLDPIALVAFTESAGQIELRWTITTGNVDGVVRGAFTAIADEPIQAEKILPELKAQPRQPSTFIA